MPAGRHASLASLRSFYTDGRCPRKGW